GWWRRESRARGLRPAPPASAGTTAGWWKGSRQQRARSASAVRHFASWAILPALAVPLGRGGDGPLQLIGDDGREARRARRELVSRLDVSLFHKVERPLQAQQHTLDAGAVLPHHADAESRAEHHRCNRDEGEGTERQEDGRARHAGTAERRAATDEAAPDLPHVRRQGDVHVSRLERRERGVDGLRLVQHERPLAPAESGGGATDRRLEATHRLPADPARLPPLQHQQLVLFHVGKERALDALHFALHDALSGGACRARDPVEKAGRLVDGDPAPLLQDGLLQVPLGNADFLPQQKDLLRRHVLALVLARLQLGCALEDALECSAVDPGRRSAVSHSPSGPPALAPSPAPQCGTAAGSDPAPGAMACPWPSAPGPTPLRPLRRRRRGTA